MSGNDMERYRYRAEFERIMDRLGDRAEREPLVIDAQADREIRALVRDIAGQTQQTSDNQTMTGLPDCVLCAVRQLTEGDAPIWQWRQPGDQVSGVVMRVEDREVDGTMGITAASVTLWTGGMSRVRVQSPNAIFMDQVHAGALRVGDRATIQYLGKRPIERGRMAGKLVNDWQVTVERGHH